VVREERWEINKESVRVRTFLASEESIPLGTSVNGLHISGAELSASPAQRAKNAGKLKLKPK
jgi:hypothetical protein